MRGQSESVIKQQRRQFRWSSRNCIRHAQIAPRDLLELVVGTLSAVDWIHNSRVRVGAGIYRRGACRLSFGRYRPEVAVKSKEAVKNGLHRE